MHKQSKILIHGQADDQPSPVAQGSITLNSDLGRENSNSLNVPPFLLLPPALYAEHDMVWGISLSQLPHSLLPIPSPLSGKATWEAEKSGILCRYSWAIDEAANVTTLFSPVIQIKHRRCCYGDNQLCPNKLNTTMKDSFILRRPLFWGWFNAVLLC